MIPYRRTVLSVSQYAEAHDPKRRTVAGLSTALRRAPDDRQPVALGRRGKERLYELRQLHAALTGAVSIPPLPEPHERDLLSLQDIVDLDPDPNHDISFWQQHERRSEPGTLRGFRPDRVINDPPAKPGEDGEPRSYWYRSTADEIITSIGPRGWTKGKPRGLRGPADDPLLDQVAARLRAEPDLTGAQLASMFEVNERKALRLAARARDRLLDGVATIASSDLEERAGISEWRARTLLEDPSCPPAIGRRGHTRLYEEDAMKKFLASHDLALTARSSVETSEGSAASTVG